MCWEACKQVGAPGDIPGHTCIDIPDVYNPGFLRFGEEIASGLCSVTISDGGPSGQSVSRSGTDNILQEVLDAALNGASKQEIRDCADALAWFRGRKSSLEFFRAAYEKHHKNPVICTVTRKAFPDPENLRGY
jgi:hypothetical protein